MQMGQPDTVPGDAAAAAEAGKSEGDGGEAGKVAEAAAAASALRLLEGKVAWPKIAFITLFSETIQIK